MPSQPTRLAALFVTTAALVASAESTRERYERDLQEELSRTNAQCASSIVMAPLDWDAFESASAGGPASVCRVLKDLRTHCTKDRSNDPHPGAQRFVKENISSIACAIGPPTSEKMARVKVSLVEGVLSFEVSNPNYDAQDLTRAALLAEPSFAKLAEIKRSWGLANEELPKAAERVKAACGDDLTVELDLPSWQRGGHGKTYPDLDLAGICEQFAAGLAEACEANKKSVRARVDGLRCGFLGTGHENDPPVFRFEKKTLVVMSGTVSAGANASRAREAVTRAAAGKK